MKEQRLHMLNENPTETGIKIKVTAHMEQIQQRWENRRKYDHMV